MIGIDLFSGAGGMSVGAMKAGINVLLSIEKDKFAHQTFKYNHPETISINEDIRAVSELPSFDRTQEIVLFGGPPCQGFSTSNQRTRNRSNPNNWLFKEILRFTGMIKPDWVVIENVKGMVQTEKSIFPDMIARDLNALGYTVNRWILEASSFGVPQKRTRLFIIGCKHGLTLPQPVSISKTVTVKDAIFDLPVLASGASDDVLPYSQSARHTFSKRMRKRKQKVSNNLVTKNAAHIIERYNHVPLGGNWTNIPENLMRNYSDTDKCHSGIYRRLDWSKPSCVIANYRKNMLIHPSQNRGLSVREAARLQSFPDWFHFTGTIGHQQQQVGNAVPPLLARAVFTQILQSRELSQQSGIAI